MALRIFRTPRHNKFGYNPQYWDPKKEELEERLHLADKKTRNDPEAMKARIAAGMRRSTSGGGIDNRSYRAQQIKKSNRVLVLTIMVLCVLAYLILVYYAGPAIKSAMPIQ